MEIGAFIHQDYALEAHDWLFCCRNHELPYIFFLIQIHFPEKSLIYLSGKAVDGRIALFVIYHHIMEFIDHRRKELVLGDQDPY